MFRSSTPVVFSNKDTAQIQSEPTGEETRRSAIPIKSLCNFIEITCTDAPPRIHITPAKYLTSGEHLW